MKRRVLVLVALAFVLGGFFAGVASAHVVEKPEYGYYAQYVGGATLYRCASGANKLEHAIDIGPSSFTGSRQQYLCGTTYPVAASNVRTSFVLVKWVSGTPTTCFESNLHMNTSTNWKVQSPVYDIPTSICDPGAYSVTSFHRVYILGTPRDALLPGPGTHNF